MKSNKLQRPLRVSAIVVLLLGISSSLLIYLTAGDDSNGAFGYEADGVYVYQVRPEDSKLYRHDLELYGGKANVLADDFRRWFVALWHGRSLAFTVAGCSVLFSLGLFAAAGNLPPGGTY